MQVPIQRTVASPRQYAKAFIKAWLALGYDTTPTQAQVGVLYAQWMVETGGAACWCWNVGNVKVTQGQVDAGVPWFDLPGTWEIIGGMKKVLQPGDPGRRFRAFTSLDEAMGEHLAFLRNKRYARSWPCVEAGDPDGFARALKAQGYYTAPVEDYARIMREHHAMWMKSKAYSDALSEVLDEDEKDTIPEGLTPGSYRVEEPAAIVHTLTYDLARDPDSEPPPPDEAA